LLVTPTLFSCPTKRYWVDIFATTGRDCVPVLHSKLRADITITIRRIIIRIHIERARIRAIIRVTADIDNVVD